MAGLSYMESRKRYSWWWDSHISPKNSKWLQENLTGMDSKVKQMIKLIEEDADSFARRAEMYYKRRPELMRLVEEFYRAYRALAERYDHATGVIRHAHKTMVEAFPDQDPSLMSDELDGNSPFMPPSVREFFDPELQKDALGLSSPDIQVAKGNRTLPDEPEFIRGRKGLRQIDFFEKGGARKGLNFNETREERNSNNNIANTVGIYDSKNSVSKHVADISLLKESLAKLEAEKEDGLVKYQNSLERLYNMEKEVRLAQEDSDKLSERAIKAEAEVELLKGALRELKAEKELFLLQYQQCLNKISIMEEQILHYEQDSQETVDQAKRAESEVQLLKQDLAMLQAEKEAIAAQHKQCLETITDVETKLQQAEESVRRANERAKVAESKVETLNLDIVELTEEKKAFSVQCQQYREKISTLEFQILFSQEEAQRLNEEISNGVVKLKEAEEQCLSIATSHESLQSDLVLLIRKMESKNKELTEKQMELNRLWTCVQEERSRFVEAETAFQTLQHLHHESQEELTALASELRNRAQIVIELEEHNHGLQEEVLKIKEDNRTLNEINLSAAVSMENMQDEILNLRATIVKLHEEIQTQVNERNVLQQEIYCLREEFDDLKLKHGKVLEQMESLELDPESFGSSVMELRDNSLKLNDGYEREKNEKVALLEKLDIMASLVEKNAMLEKSIADLSAELQQAKDKVKSLEETCLLLVEERPAIVVEKNALHSQIKVLTDNLSALSEVNVSLEISLANANTELEVLKEKSTKLEDSLMLIDIEKTRLLNENETLSSQLKVMKHRLEDSEIKCEELDEKNFDMGIEKQILICITGELCNLLNLLKKENADSAKYYQTQLASLEHQLHLLQEEAQLSKNLYNDELDTTLRAEIEISILHECLQKLHGNNTSMGHKCLQLFEASQTSEKHISYLEQENADSAKFYQSQLANLEYKLHLLQEEAQLSKNLYNDEMDTSLRAEIEISILHECLQELHGNNTSMGHKCLQLFEASQTSEKHISYLEQENADSAKFYQTQLASLEYQLHLLQEEAQLSKNLYYDELDTTLRAEIEISVLHNCLRDLHGNNTSLGQKCLQLFEASQTLEKHIASLTQQNADQQVDSKALLDVLDKLRVGFSQMATILDFDVGIRHGCMYGDLPFSIQSHSNQILETSENVEKALTATLDEKQQLVLEKSVLITLLQQIKLEVVEINAEKCIISQNLKAGAQRLLKLSMEVQGHLEANEELRRTVEDEDFREKMLRDDIQELSSNLLDLQWSYQTLQQANNLVLVENKRLMTELADFKGANCALEEEICDAIGDALSLNNIVLVFQDFFSDKLMEVKELEESMHQLHQIKDTLQDVIKELEEKLQILLDDKSHLMESIAESDNELKTLRSINRQLNVEVSNGKELLHQKETDFSEMKLKLETLLNEQTRLQLTNEDLKRGYEMMAVIKEEQAVLIFKLAIENGMKSAENADLRASQHCLETELLELINKHENVKTSEVALESELQRWKTKELLYEKEYEGLFREHQISAILEACYHEKFQELHKKYESTTSKISSMDLEAQLLKQKLTVLEVENAGLKAHFNEYDSAVKSLSNSMASLESQAILHEKLSKINLTKDAELKQVHVQDKSDAVLATGCTELKDLQSRIQAVELAVNDIQKLPGPIDLVQSSLLPTKELESGSSFRQERAGARRLIHHYSDASSEINEFPKDIMLDQISDCSPYGLSSKEITAADTRILELWGTTNSRLSFSDATGQKLSRGKRISSSEITAEKEMTVVDKLEIPTSREDPQQTGKKVKILERLHFDAEKLANIQKSVQDLKSKVGIAEKSKKTKGVIEYDTVTEQLEEAEEAIEKLFGVNKKLTRTVEDDSDSLKSENGSEESSTVRRRRVLEQIRRASEKISRLHFEVQKLQFLLQKLEGEKEVLVKTRITPRSPRVRLRDYLYGSSGQVFSHKQKRKRFCGCIQPSTKGD